MIFQMRRLWALQAIDAVTSGPYTAVRIELSMNQMADGDVSLRLIGGHAECEAAEQIIRRTIMEIKRELRK